MKIQEIIKSLHDLLNLISTMRNELELYRNLLYRYHLKHGDTIEEGAVQDITDNIQFGIAIDDNDNVKCTMIDCDKLGITSKYQIINTELKKYL